MSTQSEIDNHNTNGNGIGAEKSYSSHAELSRQITLNLSPDQYERLFFQPSAGKGDLSKRLGTVTYLNIEDAELTNPREPNLARCPRLPDPVLLCYLLSSRLPGL